ncbi:chemosensory receptor B [Elysia marginata]|uniref:Chemosensory receptor B n=1 Tax=Elysia marginata TaxID=1093978 RepID=A0AAV4EF73_9GAST|nr:chemosensory receptor B [Elysia marginata]
MDTYNGNATKASSSLEALDGLVSENLFWQLMTAILALDLILALVAAAANIVTIRVYKKMGFADSTNISLTALALSDLGCAITAINCVLAIFLPTIPNAPFTFEIFVTSASHPHVMFSRISALITAYIGIERYLCVWIPLKVKRIITTRRTFAAMVIIFSFSIALNLHLSVKFPIGWKFFPDRNRTLLGVLPVTDRGILTLDYVRQVLFSVILPVCTSVIAVFTAILLSLALKRNKTWRDANKALPPSSTASGRKDASLPANLSSTDSKEARAVKMVIAITAVFITSSIPSSIHMVFVFTVPEFEVNGRYSNMYALTGMAFLIADSLNCSANVIIYYKMSSKFRKSLQDIFCS